MKDKVSVIVPNYNHAPFLEERINSILNQTHQNFELILLDDASTDKSVDVLKKYSDHKKVSHFIINKNNSGSPFKQWEKGLALTKGDFIWIAESDDSCDVNFLELQLKNIRNADIIIAKTVSLKNNIKTDITITHPIFKSNKSESLSIDHFTKQCPIRNISAIIFKSIDRESIQKTTYSNYHVIGDVMFYYELFKNKQVVYNKETKSYFRQNGGGLSSIDTKDLSYFKTYFDEHVMFMKNISKQNEGISKNIIRTYIKRKFNKIRNRIATKDKYSLLFLTIYLKYKYHSLIAYISY